MILYRDPGACGRTRRGEEKGRRSQADKDISGLGNQDPERALRPVYHRWQQERAGSQGRRTQLAGTRSVRGIARRRARQEEGRKGRTRSPEAPGSQTHASAVRRLAPANGGQGAKGRSGHRTCDRSGIWPRRSGPRILPLCSACAR